MVAMSGMGDGYVGTAQDAARIRRLEKQREAERKRIQDLKKKSAEGQGGLLQFGSGTSEVRCLRLRLRLSHFRALVLLSIFVSKYLGFRDLALIGRAAEPNFREATGSEFVRSSNCTFF